MTVNDLHHFHIIYFTKCMARDIYNNLIDSFHCFVEETKITFINVIIIIILTLLV